MRHWMCLLVFLLTPVIFGQPARVGATQATPVTQVAPIPAQVHVPAANALIPVATTTALGPICSSPSGTAVPIALDDTGIADVRFTNPRRPAQVNLCTSYGVEFHNLVIGRDLIVNVPFEISSSDFTELVTALRKSPALANGGPVASVKIATDTPPVDWGD